MPNLQSPTMPYKYPIHPYPIPPVPQPARPTLQDYTRDRNAITDIIFLHLKPNTPIEDPSTPAGKLWMQALDSIRGSEDQKVQPQPGFGRLYWGRAEEADSDTGADYDVVLLMIDWDDLSLHKQHQSQSQTQSQPSITTILSPLLHPTSSTTRTISAKFTPYPPLVASSTSSPPYPLTTLTIAKFPASMDSAEKAQIPALWQYTRQDLQPRGAQRRHGCLGAAGGWMMGSSGEGEGEEEGGGWYVMLDAWEEKGKREEWQAREEADLLWRKWEERATGGMWMWSGRLRM